MASSCSCIWLDEEEPVVIDPSCSTHRLLDKGDVMGAHAEMPKGLRQTIREGVRPPVSAGRAERIGWYIGIFLGALVVCVLIGAMAGLLIGLINWFRL